MENFKKKIFIGLALLSAVVFIIGAIFFLSNPFDLSDSQFILAGCVSVLIGVMLSSYKYSAQWLVSFGVVVIGIYLILRGTGWIGLPWLTWAVGVAFVLAAAALCFVVSNELSKKQ